MENKSETNIPSETYFALSRELEKHHALFYAVWNIGRPMFTNDIPTAAVRFNVEGEFVEFLFNKEYWDKMSDYQRTFVICHECLHVILNHGARIRDIKDALVANVALDVVVNHTLVNRFGFQREDVFDQQNLCWVDTVFKDQNVSDNECFEYYFVLLKKAAETQDLSNLSMPDDHSSLGDNFWDEVIEKVSETLSDEDKESLQDFVEGNYQEDNEFDEGMTEPPVKSYGQQAGTGTTGAWQFAKVEKAPIKKKWESIIKKWSLRYDRAEFKDIEQWARLNRRLSTLDSNLILPSDMELEYEVEGKINVMFFQDTSASCSGYRDRFFKAAMTLNPKRFDIELFCFDTQVYKTSLESKKLYGFGGTTFHQIEDYIQKTTIDKGKKYPEAVFVITDGYGNQVSPVKPKNWYIFLTTQYKNCFPQDCNFFQLKDFE